ncbi:AraC family transcriptional regulator [Nocardia sp. NBC_01503]|uniref:helix-turn-helix transcriptional regulator n=1 Tax=Nocardia sp. NBC_01503 TaxID=2975997 RepID=UPI002E7B24B7|nr:AraC family transcriptional regulator ligand-binding domain-containing protein [Nocardia sp. NBC_01503]WTL29935.1 AraC family transcriptional regulator [Nocardia sp. NBC_01503]
MSEIEGTVSSHLTRSVLEAAVQIGVPDREIAAIAGLGRELLGDDFLRIPSTALLRLWELICAAGGVGVGVRVAELAPPGRLHIWDYLILGASNLAEGFTDAARFAAVMADPAATLVVTADDHQLIAEFRGRPYGATVAAVVNEFSLTVLLHRARAIAGHAADPIRVDFTHPAPPDPGYLIETFGTGNIHFDQDRTALVLPIAERTRDGRPYDPELRQILLHYAKLIIDTARPAPTWEDTLRAEISAALIERQSAEIEVVAQRLAVSPRTLQRRLADHGTSWRRELEAVRCQQATRLLRDTRLPVQSIAGRVGYRDQRALRRAFHRWTGQTPDAYRRCARN